MGSSRLLFVAYNLLLWGVSLAAVPFILIRSRVKGMPWSRMPERFGLLPAAFGETPAGGVWLHAVSVGEAVTARRLVDTLRRKLPDVPLYVSTATPTGQEIAREKLGERVDGVFYAPLDLGPCVRGVLRRLKPRLVIVMETEIWPNLFRETKRAGAGLIVANARISDRALPRYRRFAFFFRRVLPLADRVLAQSDADADRFRELGADPAIVETGGNLKYDAEPGGGGLAPDVERFLERTAAETKIVAGSTREGEEAALVEAFREVARKRPRSLLLLAPRHPERAPEAERAATDAGFPCLRRSQLTDASALSLPAVFVADTLGELQALYSVADVVFVGGSLNGWGGHNVLEPASLAKAIVVGPHMQNFRAIADDMLRNEAMVQVTDGDKLGRALFELLEAPERARVLGENAREAARAQRGAAERISAAAKEALGEAVAAAPLSGGRRLLLSPPAALWSLGARLRLAAYRSGIVGSKRLPHFTLCVGNLTAGGSGKTPTVLRLVEALARRGRHPAVLTRGYRRASTDSLVLSQPGDAPDSAKLGDEAALLRRRFDELGLNVSIGVGADRARSAEALLDRAQADLFVLDDGFQHLGLERDLDLVLIDVSKPLEFDSTLPLGRLREPPSGLARASAFLLTRCEEGQRYPRIERLLRRYNSEAPVFRSAVQPTLVIEARSGKLLDLGADRIREKRMAIFSGVGSPDSFLKTVERTFGAPAAELRFGDHHRYAFEDWNRIVRTASACGAEILLTTEKDLENLDPGVPRGLRADIPPLYALRVEMRIDEEQRLLDWVERKIEAAS